MIESEKLQHYLDNLGLTDAQVEDRRGYIGVSDLNTICGDNLEWIMQLWKVKRGLVQPEDLSDKVQVLMGSVTEEYNLALFQKKTDIKITARKTQRTHPDHPWLKAQPDAEAGVIPVEAKHVGPWSYSIDAVRERYLPQLAGQMACSGADSAYLTVLSGNSTHEYCEVERDEIYIQQIIAAGKRFWDCVLSGEEPVTIPEITAPVPAALLRKVDLSQNNAWCALEQDYLKLEPASIEFDTTKKSLKSLVLDDVGQATGQFIVAKRDKRNAIRFTKKKD